MLRGSPLVRLEPSAADWTAPRGAGAVKIRARITVRLADAGCLRPGGV